MRAFDLIRRRVLRFVSRLWNSQGNVSRARKETEPESELHLLEAERLDRIRQPWKYRGK